MANKNAGLNAAGKAKKDEFYTQLTDIEKELRHYRQHFRGKTVFCNCDDPFESNFFKYFVLNFGRLGLKKLIATCYAGSPIANRQLSLFDVVGDGPEKQDRPYRAIVNTVYDKTGDGGIDMLDVAELFRSGENELTELQGDGDFRSPESLALMDEADIVVTNPPFSLFREYVAVLMEHQKKFIIIGNQNAITYKEIFTLLKDNKMWLGYGFAGNIAFFESPYEDTAASSQHREGLIRVSGVMWFTNLDIRKRHDELILFRKYDSENYPNYENYNAININKVVEIPRDYAGVMGVPITFMDKYSPEQFEILMMANGNARTNTDAAILKAVSYVPDDRDKGGLGIINGKLTYARILIRNKHPEPPQGEPS